MRSLATKPSSTEIAARKPATDTPVTNNRSLSTLSTYSPVLQRQCACGGGCPSCKDELGIQTKLKISEPGDMYEQEADRVADEVMRMPEPTIQRQMEPDEDVEEMIQTKAINNSITPLQRSYNDPNRSAEVPDIVHEVLRSPGQPLDPATRALMEPRFGHDFSQVRVHTGGDADRSAQDVNARAYTVGNNIVFGASQFSQGTHEGQRLLAHELTHVVQQSGLDGLRVNQSHEKVGLSSLSLSTTQSPQILARQAALQLPVRPPVPTRPPLRSIPGGRGSARAFPAAEGQGRYATPPDRYDNSLDAIFERADMIDYADRERMKAEIPIATLDRGGNPPDFITVDGSKNVEWVGGPGGGGRVTARVRRFHVLNAIESEVGQATSEEQLEEVLNRYVPMVALLNQVIKGTYQQQPIRIILFPWDQPMYGPNFDPGSQARLQVFEAAIQKRIQSVPALAKTRLIPQTTKQRGGCRIEPISPLGGDPMSVLYCHLATGSPYSYKITIESSTGGLTKRWAEIDSLRGNTWYECKCGYEALLSGSARGLGVAEAVLNKLDTQVLNHLHIARTCGLEYRYIVSNERVAEILRRRWFGNVVLDVVPFEGCD